MRTHVAKPEAATHQNRLDLTSETPTAPTWHSPTVRQPGRQD